MAVTVIPGPKIQNLIDQHQWGSLELDELGPFVTGSGVTSHVARQARAGSGSTASSTAWVKSGTLLCWSAGQNLGVIDWTKPITLHLVLCMDAATTNGKSRVSWGKSAADGEGDLARKAIGIRVDNLGLKGIVHDGTSETTVDLSATLVENTTYRVMMKSDGSGNVEWFLDGVSKGSSSAGPTTTGTAGESVIQIESANNADAAAHTIRVADAKYYIEQ